MKRPTILYQVEKGGKDLSESWQDPYTLEGGSLRTALKFHRDTLGYRDCKLCVLFCLVCASEARSKTVKKGGSKTQQKHLHVFINVFLSLSGLVRFAACKIGDKQRQVLRNDRAGLFFVQYFRGLRRRACWRARASRASVDRVPSNILSEQPLELWRDYLFPLVRQLQNFSTSFLANFWFSEHLTGSPKFREENLRLEIVPELGNKKEKHFFLTFWIQAENLKEKHAISWLKILSPKGQHFCRSNSIPKTFV